jgi:hypothetical protein
MVRFRLFVTCALFVSIALAQTTSDYDALVQKGKTQLQAGSADLALASGEGAIKINADRWEAYALVGGALMNLKRYEEAADKFSKAIEKAPEAKQAALRDLRRQCLLSESGGSPAPKETVPAATTSQAEIVLWKTIEHSSNPADFEAYLTKYPTGAFGVLAQQRMEELKARAQKRESAAIEGGDLGSTVWKGRVWFTETSRKHGIHSGDQLDITIAFDDSGQFTMDQTFKGQSEKGVMSGSWSVKDFKVTLRMPAQGYRCAEVMEGTRRQDVIDGTANTEGDTSRCDFVKHAWNLRKVSAAQ